MPYVEHNRITFGGTLGQDSPAPEEWSCNISVSPLATLPVPSDLWDALALFIEWGKVADYVSMRYYKVSRIGPDGLVIGDVFRYDDIANGSGESNRHPFQVALVCSLRTPLRGPSHRGRFYVPGPNVDISSDDGLMSEADQAEIATRWQNALIAVQAAIGDHPIMVASKRGYNTAVTGINVGRALDTVRRRRRSLDEAYDGPLPI